MIHSYARENNNSNRTLFGFPYFSSILQSAPKSPAISVRPSRLFQIYKLTIRCLIQGGASHAFRKTTAGAFGPDLAKKLSQLVKMEKNVMRSMELVGRERMEVAVSLPPSQILDHGTELWKSNNYRSGVKRVTMMFRTSRISLVF